MIFCLCSTEELVLVLLIPIFHCINCTEVLKEIMFLTIKSDSEWLFQRYNLRDVCLLNTKQI